jgi:hypothetical protein
VRLSEIQPAFRLDGNDADVDQVVERFTRSGLPRAVFLFPGLLSDEGLWTYDGDEGSIDALLVSQGACPIHLRFNPGVHVSQNGKSALELMQGFMERFPGTNARFDALTFSLGGLILRSALYQARQRDIDIASRLGRVVLVSCPDGGSYLEKLGFLLATGLEDSYLPVLHLLGQIGNQRSDAIRDLSHGIIREEDWKNYTHFKRYGRRRYFGELDDVDAYQIYSLIHEGHDLWKEWIGDGIVEKASLTLLSQVYNNKGPAAERVHEVRGKSHFQVLHAAETRAILARIFASPAKEATIDRGMGI